MYLCRVWSRRVLSDSGLCSFCLSFMAFGLLGLNLISLTSQFTLGCSGRVARSDILRVLRRSCAVVSLGECRFSGFDCVLDSFVAGGCSTSRVIWCSPLSFVSWGLCCPKGVYIPFPSLCRGGPELSAGLRTRSIQDFFF